MKTLTTLTLNYLQQPTHRRNLRILLRFVLIFLVVMFIYSMVFHLIMWYEGRRYSWIAGFYWTLTLMSTLGLGDIVFTSDVGYTFSMLVMISGGVFMLILLPFTFIQFFYAPWLEAQAEARAPRQLPPQTDGHVILTRFGSVEATLIRKLRHFHVPYAVIVPEITEALRLHDIGYDVMLGELDDPETYRRARAEHASLVACTGSDTMNTNIAFTVRESCESTPIVATASFAASVDILELAGCHRVLQLGEMLGQSLARRVVGRDAKSHVIGRFGKLLIAEASAANTPLVGRTLRETRLREWVNVNVLGVWDRGRFRLADPETKIRSTAVLVMAGSRSQLAAYDELFCIYNTSTAPVVIIGGGRVGRATGRALEEKGVDYRIVERLPERIRDPQKYIMGDAAELEVLNQAGFQESSTVVITTHEDDINVYLTIYCRRLRPDIQILGRATQERNISTLHRAGADFVLSYASMGANAIFNLLRRSNVLMMAEGLDVFQLPVPPSLKNRTLAETAIRHETGCNVVAVVSDGQMEINPDATRSLPQGSELILIGDAESEERFLMRYGKA